ncbi:MAG: hypothetical protein ACOCZ5_03040 [bacterium]
MKRIEGFILTDEEMIKLTDLVSNGSLSKIYDIDTLETILSDNFVSLLEMVDIYFDDMVNVCETREQMIEYMREVASDYGMKIHEGKVRE